MIEFDVEAAIKTNRELSEGSNHGKRKPRRGSAEVLEILRQLKDVGGLSPGSLVMAKTILAVLRESNVSGLWRESPTAKDSHGPTRAVGDILGKHGLRLRRSKGGFIMPDQLPALEEGTLVSNPRYLDGDDMQAGTSEDLTTPTSSRGDHR